MKKVISLICLAIVMVFSLEAVLWIAFPLPEEVSQPRIKTLYQKIPGLKNEVTLEEKKFLVRAPSLKSLAKDPGVIRVAFIGASTVEQAQQNIQDTYYAHLEKHFNEILAPECLKTEFIGWGRGGYVIWQTYPFIRNDLFNFHPDIVVLLFGINDLAFHGGPSYFYGERKARINAINTEYEQTAAQQRIQEGEEIALQERRIRKIARFFRRYSQIYRRLRRIRHNYLLKAKINRGEAIDWHTKNLPFLRKNYENLPFEKSLTRNPDPAIEFKDGLDTIVNELTSRGVSVLILGQPVLWKDAMSEEEQKILWFYVNGPKGRVRMDPAWLEKEMMRFNRIQEAVATQHHVTYLNLDNAIPKTSEYFFDDCHYTDKGSEAMAEAIFPSLETLVRSKSKNAGALAQCQLKASPTRN